MTCCVPLRVRGLLRLAAVVPVLASLTVVGAATKTGPSVGGCAQAATTHHAALVVEHSDGSGHGAGAVIRVCVPFTGDSITGDMLLRDSGVPYATGDSGQAVCQIDNEPAQFQPQCLSSGNPYWAMFISSGGGSWTYSSLGFASQAFHDGDAEGFRFEGQSDGTTPPSPSGVCPVSATAGPIPPRSTPVPRTHGVSTAGPTASASPPVRSAVTAPSPPGAAGSPLPSPSATARSGASVVSTNRSTPLRPASSGAWVAGGLGGLLILGLVAQLARVRRRSQPRAPR